MKRWNRTSDQTLVTAVLEKLGGPKPKVAVKLADLDRGLLLELNHRIGAALEPEGHFQALLDGDPDAPIKFRRGLHDA